MWKAATGLCLLAAMTTHAVAYDACVVPDGLALSENDTSRLENLDTSRTRGLGAAMRAADAGDREIVAGLFDPGLSYVNPDLLPGDYDCRTIKLGYEPALVVYQWFQCEITKDASGFSVRKLTGSQNFSGTLTKAGSGYAYRGALSYGYEDGTRKYGDDAEFDQVGCLSAVTKESNHFLLELPFPKVESFHDVIEFRARR